MTFLTSSINIEYDPAGNQYVQNLTANFPITVYDENWDDDQQEYYIAGLAQFPLTSGDPVYLVGVAGNAPVIDIYLYTYDYVPPPPAPPGVSPVDLASIWSFLIGGMSAGAFGLAMAFPLGGRL